MPRYPRPLDLAPGAAAVAAAALGLVACRHEVGPAGEPAVPFGPVTSYPTAAPSAPPPSASGATALPTASIAAPTTDPRLCALDPEGWCPAPEGDPCGAHRDVASCRADVRCGGMPYRGESKAQCQRDERGFGQNCPTVGCVSLGR